VLLLCFLILFINSFLNAIIFKFNGESWRTSFYAGALLAQIGEFSFVLATIGMENSLLSAFGYQLIIQVIALSLIISPIWINIFLRFVDQSEIIIRNTKKMAEKHPGYIYHPPISGQKNTPPSVSRKNPPKK